MLGIRPCKMQVLSMLATVLLEQERHTTVVGTGISNDAPAHQSNISGGTSTITASTGPSAYTQENEDISSSTIVDTDHNKERDASSKEPRCLTRDSIHRKTVPVHPSPIETVPNTVTNRSSIGTKLKSSISESRNLKDNQIAPTSFRNYDCIDDDTKLGNKENLNLKFPDSSNTTKNKEEKDAEPSTSVQTATTSMPYWMDPNWIPMTTVPTMKTDHTGSGSRNSNGTKHRRHFKKCRHGETTPPTPQPQMKTPHQIRLELKRYLKSDKGRQKTKTSLLSDMGVNSNSFRKFMDESRYKDPWRAIENGTYWAAARYLEAERMAPNRIDTSVATEYVKRIYTAPTTSTGVPTWTTVTETTPSLTSCTPEKNTATTTTRRQLKSTLVESATTSTNNASQQPYQDSCSRIRAKACDRDAALQYMERIDEVCAPDMSESPVRDSWSQIIEKIQTFLQLPGVSKTNFCEVALRGVSRKQLDKLLRCETQEECSSLEVYSRAKAFFERKRRMDGAPTSTEPCSNERGHSHGFSFQQIADPPDERISHRQTTHEWNDCKPNNNDKLGRRRRVEGQGHPETKSRKVLRLR